MNPRLTLCLGTVALLAAPARALGETPDPARDLLLRAQRQFSELPGYQSELTFFQRQGERTARGRYEVTGRPSHQLRIVIREGTGQGTRLYWDGGRSARVRPGGWLSALVVPLALDDPRLLSIRGYPIDQTELGNFLGLLADPRNAPLSLQRGDGELLFAVEGPHLLAGCTRMTMAMEPTTLLPRAVSLFEGPQLVFEMTLQHLRVVPHVSFEL